VHRVRDRANRDTAADDSFPKLLPRLRIESMQTTIQVAPEDQVAGSSQYGSVGGSALLTEAHDLARLHVDLSDPVQFLRIRARARHALSLAAFDVVEADVDIGNVHRIS